MKKWKALKHFFSDVQNPTKRIKENEESEGYVSNNNNKDKSDLNEMKISDLFSRVQNNGHKMLTEVRKQYMKKMLFQQTENTKKSEDCLRDLMLLLLHLFSRVLLCATP